MGVWYPGGQVCFYSRQNLVFQHVALHRLRVLGDSEYVLICCKHHITAESIFEYFDFLQTGQFGESEVQALNNLLRSQFLNKALTEHAALSIRWLVLALQQAEHVLEKGFIGDLRGLL